MKLTKSQQIALARKWDQSNQGLTYVEFRRTIEQPYGADGPIMVAWCGMWLGIEIDGYCHS
jgi:hypothetical protein